MLSDPKSVKIQSSHQYLFALLGLAHVKAARKTLMKLTPDFQCLIEFVIAEYDCISSTDNKECCLDLAYLYVIAVNDSLSIFMEFIQTFVS